MTVTNQNEEPVTFWECLLPLISESSVFLFPIKKLRFQYTKL